MHKLEVDSIYLDFGTRNILSDIHLECHAGEVVGLLGRNGQGKTCLMNIIYGTLESNYKSIRLDDRRLVEAYKISKDIRYLPQFNFLPGFLNMEAVFNLFETEFSIFRQFFPGFEHSLKTNIANLSGGQKRLLETYLIITSRTAFVLLDEPFTHLTPLLVEKIKEIIIIEKRNKGFIITDHLFREIITICDKYYLLANGKTHLISDFLELAELGYVHIES